jgi:hypothetical protein
MDWRHLPAIQNALHQGLFAIRDMKRAEFYEIEVADNWYYIHIPSRIAGVYLIAARRESAAKRNVRRSNSVAEEALSRV